MWYWFCCIELFTKDLSQKIMIDGAMNKKNNNNLISETNHTRLESVFHHATIGIDIVDKDGRIIDCNPAFERLFGYPRAELCKMTSMDLAHPEDVVVGRDLHMELLAGKRTTFQVEKRYYRKDGSLLWARLNVSMFETHTRDAQLVISMVEDITDQKKSEAALRESEERFRRLSTAAFEGIFIHKGNVVLDANDQFAHLLGLEKGSELVGRSGWRYVGRDTRREVIRHIREKDERPFEGSVVTAQGDVIQVELVGRAIPWEGTTVGVVAVRDIRERKQAESARRLLENQLFQAERLATVGTVASGIVHNLKNPLTGIMGYTDLLKVKYPKEDFIASIQNAVNLMRDMVENILAKGRRQHKHEWINLHHLLQRELEFLETDPFFKREIKTEVSFGADVPSFWGTYTDLSQIFGNLLRNAVESMYNRAKKELRISAYLKDGFICVDIQDTGCGISQDQMATLFDPFVTNKLGDETTPQGTGLGLYMVRQLLETYHAPIDVSSKVGEGTLFQVRLPLKGEMP